MKVLVTGSTGLLGTALIKKLENTDYEVKLTSRNKPKSMDDCEWVYSDLLSGDGLEEALQDVDIVIHAATSPIKNSRAVEIDGLSTLLKNAHHIQHFIYPSIVGIEDVPLSYYKLKFEAERLLETSSVPHTIARATQFHDYVEKLFLSKPRFKRYLIPGKIKFQSVDVAEYADYLVNLIEKGPQGRVDDFGGPEILTLRDMAEMKIRNNQENYKIFNFSLPLKLYHSLLEGKNTNASRKMGKVTFEEHLKKRA